MVLIDPKKPHKEPIMVHISRCKPINKDDQRENVNQTDENQARTSQSISNNRQQENKSPVIQKPETTTRYPLRSRGVNINTFMMITLVCLTNMVGSTNSYTQKTLGPGVMK